MVDQEDLSVVAYTLEVRGLIFDYATEYYYTHPEITSPDDFTLSDKEYDDFKKWLEGKDYSYMTHVEQDLNEMRQDAKGQKYYPLIEKQLAELQKVIDESKAKDLDLFSSQIRYLLEKEIVERYYLESGGIESTFDEDQSIKTAIAVLNDPAEINRILKAN